MGFLPERGDSGPHPAGGAGPTGSPTVPRRGRAASQVLGWIPGRTRDDRILAGAREPAARSHPLPPRWRRVADGAAFPVAYHMARPSDGLSFIHLALTATRPLRA